MAYSRMHNNNWLKRITLTLSLCLLAACATVPELERVPLNATARLDLASSWPGKPTQQLHQVTWSHAEHTPQVFLISSYLSNSEVTVIGLSPLGQELWRVFLTPGKPIAASGI